MGIVTRMQRYPARITLTLVLALLFAEALTASPADAASTFTVNSTADPGTGSCDSTECSLREAITAANTNAGTDTINFNIPGSGVKTIAPISALPTITNAVNIDSGSGDTIGGTVAGARNVISANQGDGVFISGSQVQGNYIGTDKNGTRPAGAPDLGNSSSGVSIGSQGNNTLIGGTATGASNVISDNSGSGVVISGNSNQVQRNYVGTDASGTASLGNSFDGVTVSAISNAVLANSIFSNGDLGIDLLPNGVSANDPGDPDFGANNFQNFPELTSAEVNNDGSTTIEGTLDSTSGTTFTVQFFASPSADPSNHGEGKVYLGQKTDVTTGAGGNASFSFTTQEDIGGQYVAATATSPANDTSEFSEVEQVTEVNDAPVVGNDFYKVKEDRTLKVAPPGVLSNDSDPEGDALTAMLLSSPSKGRLTLGANGSFTYKPKRNFHGTFSFTYGAHDGTAESNAAVVKIRVLSVRG